MLVIKLFIHMIYLGRFLSLLIEVLKEWDKETGTCLRTIEGHSSRVNNAAYNADGGRLLSASNDGTI